MRRIGIVNCANMPEPDPDEDLLMEALQEAGVRADLVPWDDAAWQAEDFDLCVLRSCWNYFERPADFARWVDHTAERTRLFNPPAAVKANLHKKYLAELGLAGVPIVPTAWVTRGQSLELAKLIARRGWDDVVIKPCVSAGSFRTRRFGAGETPVAQQFLDELIHDRDAMIQPYLTEVDRSGERCIVWIDGQLTHTVRKNPRFAGGTESVSSGMAVSTEEAALAQRVMRHAGEGLVYARIDVISDSNGGLLLSELELIEPSLFLTQHEGALRRFVSTLTELADGASQGR